MLGLTPQGPSPHAHAPEPRRAPWIAAAAALATMVAAHAQDAKPPAQQDRTPAQPAPTSPPATKPPSPADPKSPGDATKPESTESKSEPSSAESPRDRARADAEAALHRSLIPQPIEPAAFAAFLASIDPGLTANDAVTDAFATYTAAMKALAADPGRRMLQLAPAAYLFDGAKEAFAPRATPELVALLSLRDDAARDAEKAERTLLLAVEAATPGESRRRFVLERLRLEMGRMPTAALLPSTTLSVVDTVAKLKLSPEAMLATVTELETYAKRMTQAARERRLLLRENDALRASVETAAGTLWRYGDAENAAETARALAEIEDGEFAQELAIREIQFDAIARLRARLGTADARRVVESFQRALHPDLFEDERVLARISEELLALPSLDADRTQATVDVLELSYQRLEPLGRAACEAADLVLPRVLAESRDDGARDGSGAFLDEIRGRIALLDVQRKRRIALKESMQRLRAILGDDSPALAARFDDLAAAMQAMERADNFERRSLAAREAEIGALIGAGIPAGLVNESQGSSGAPGAAPAASEPAAPERTPGTPPTQNRNARGSRRPFNSP